MTTRQCSSCTACCEGWLKSSVLNMDLGKPCQHCTKQGCAIYDTRPFNPCISFKCAWIKDEESLPDSMRPNACGAIVMMDRRWNGMKVVFATPTGKTIPEDTLEWLKAYARKHSIPLLLRENVMKDGKYTDRKKMGYGPPSFIQAVKDAVGPDDIIRF